MSKKSISILASTLICFLLAFKPALTNASFIGESFSSKQSPQSLNSSQPQLFPFSSSRDASSESSPGSWRGTPCLPNALIVLSEPDFSKTQQFIDQIEAHTGCILHVFPPQVLIGFIPEEIKPSLDGSPEVANIFTSEIEPDFLLNASEEIQLAARMWNMSLQSEPSPAPHPNHAPLTDDRRTVELQTQSLAPDAAPGPGYYDVSDYMIGKIAVGIIIPESNGAVNTENWSTARLDQVVSEIQAAMSWWAGMNPSGHLTFYYDIHRQVSTSYEPISLSSDDDGLWLSNVMSNLGYTGASWYDQVYKYMNAIRTSLGTDWVISAFVVDSLNDLDGKFSDGYFGYSYGFTIVMTYDNDGWGIGNMDSVMAHETGHNFGAGDEYCSPGYACCWGGGQYGYLGIANSNCAAGCDQNSNGVCDGNDSNAGSNCHNCPSCINTTCLMRQGSTSSGLDTVSRQQVGMRDNDGDGILDPEDTTPGVTINALTGNYTNTTTPTITGNAVDVPYDSPVSGQPDITINNIASVQYQLDSDGIWRAASASDGSFNTPSENYTFTTASLSNGLHTVAVRAKNKVNNTSSSANYSFTVDTVPPSGSVNINSGASYTTSTSVTLNLSASTGVAQMLISNNSDLSGASWVNYATTTSWTLLSGDGTKTVYVKFRDGAGNITSTASTDTIILDTAAPVGSLSINNGAAYTDTTSVTLNINAADSGSGLSLMMIANTSDFSGASWVTYATTYPWILPGGDGVKLVYIKFKDQLGNVSSSPFADSITLDTQPPTGTLNINSGSAYTNSTSVTLAISASDSGSGLSQMMIANTSDFSGAAWQIYASSYPWNLNAADGLKTVYIKFKDAMGSITPSPSTDTITLDTTLPTGTININSGSTYTASASVTLNLTGSDSGSGISQMMVSNTIDFNGASWITFSSSSNWNLLGGDGSKTVYIKYKDGAGNISSIYTDTIILDTTPPSGSVMINSGTAYTSSTTTTLTISASDGGSGVNQMMISNSNSFSGASWLGYSTSISWTILSGDGVKTVYIKFKDQLGNTSSTPYSDTIFLDTAPPSGSLEINSGAGYTNLTSVELGLSATDSGSGVAQMMISNSSDFNGASWVNFSSPMSWIILSGNGNKTIYARFKDQMGNISSPVSDSIQLDTTNPVGSININNGSAFTSSTHVTLYLSASDSGSGVVWMIFSNSGDFGTSIWVAYSSTYNWTLLNGDDSKIVFAYFLDGAGNFSEYSYDTITLDTTPPTGTFSINSEAAFTASSSVTLNISASDLLSGMSQMVVSNTSDFSAASWVPYSSSLNWSLLPGDGTKTVYLKFMDQLGNFNSSPYTDTIILDTQPPVGSFNINNNSVYLNTTNATLILSANDSGSGMGQMMISNQSDFSGASWVNFANPYNWNLPAGDGQKIVYAKFKDQVGNVSSPVSDSVMLDTTPPSGSVSIDSGAAFTQFTNVLLDITASDTGSEIASMMVANTSDFGRESWIAYNSLLNWNLTNGDGTKTVYIKFLDIASNTSAAFTDTILLDTTPPESYILPLPAKSSPTPTIHWTGSDASGILYYDIEFRDEADGIWQPWLSGVTSTSAVFSGQKDHTYSFRCRAIDALGFQENWPPTADATTTVDVFELWFPFVVR